MSYKVFLGKLLGEPISLLILFFSVSSIENKIVIHILNICINSFINIIFSSFNSKSL